MVQQQMVCTMFMLNFAHDDEAVDDDDKKEICRSAAGMSRW